MPLLAQHTPKPRPRSAVVHRKQPSLDEPPSRSHLSPPAISRVAPNSRYSSPPAVNPTKTDTRRLHALIELVSTELGYLHDLRVLVEVYLNQLPAILDPAAGWLPSRSTNSVFLQPNNPAPSASSFNSRSFSDLTFLTRSHSALSIHRKSRYIASLPSDAVQPTPRPILSQADIALVTRNASGLLALHHRLVKDLVRVLARFGVSLSTSAISHSDDMPPEHESESKADGTDSEAANNAAGTSEQPFLRATPRRHAQSDPLPIASTISAEDWTASLIGREHLLAARIDELTDAVSSVFAAQARTASFDIYESYCARHPEALDLIRRTAERHPNEWAAFESRCGAARATMAMAMAMAMETPLASPVSAIGAVTGSGSRAERRRNGIDLDQGTHVDTVPPKKKTFEFPSAESDEDDEEDEVDAEGEERLSLPSRPGSAYATAATTPAELPSPIPSKAPITRAATGAAPSYFFAVQAPSPQVDPDKTKAEEEGKTPVQDHNPDVAVRGRRHSASAVPTSSLRHIGGPSPTRQRTRSAVSPSPRVLKRRSAGVTTVKPLTFIHAGEIVPSHVSASTLTGTALTISPLTSPIKSSDSRSPSPSKLRKRRSVDVHGRGHLQSASVPLSSSTTVLATVGANALLVPPPSPTRSQSFMPTEGPASTPRRRVPTPSKLMFLDYLIKPVQRICKYPLLLEQLRVQPKAAVGRDSTSSLMQTAGHAKSKEREEGDDNGADVESALREMRRVAERVDDARRRQEVLTKSALIASRIHVSSTRPNSSSGGSGSGATSAPANTSVTFQQQQQQARWGSGGMGMTGNAATSGLKQQHQHQPVHPQHITPSFLASLGACVLAGSLDVVNYHTLKSPLRAAGTRKVKYLGAFLYGGGYVILVKVAKGRMYELRHWFSLTGFEIVDMNEDEALLPFSFRLSFMDHHFELAAACKREKDIWLASLQESRTITPAWTNEPVPSMYDSEMDPVLAFTREEALAAPLLATIESSSVAEAEPESPLEALFQAPLASLSRSASAARLPTPGSLRNTQHFLNLDPSPSVRIPPSRRSSTNSVKSIFSAIGSATSTASSMSGGNSGAMGGTMDARSTRYLLRRATLRDRRFVDQGLADVFSEHIVAARFYAQTHNEELFPQPTDGQPGPAYTRLTKRDSLRVAPRRRLSSFESAGVVSSASEAGVFPVYGAVTNVDITASRLDISAMPKEHTVFEEASESPSSLTAQVALDGKHAPTEKLSTPSGNTDTFSRRRTLFGSRRRISVMPASAIHQESVPQSLFRPLSRRSDTMPSIVEPSTTTEAGVRTSQTRGLLKNVASLLQFTPLVTNSTAS